MIYEQCKKCAYNRKSGCVRIGPSMSLLGIVRGRKICNQFSPMTVCRIKNKPDYSLLMIRRGKKK